MLKNLGTRHHRGISTYMCFDWINGPTAACMALLLCTHEHGKEIISDTNGQKAVTIICSYGILRFFLGVYVTASEC